MPEEHQTTQKLPVQVFLTLGMGMWQPFGNLRSYLERHPPTIIFFMCLISLAITFLSFGLYVKAHYVRNPDITQDWNQILASIADLKFCVFANETDAPSFPMEHAVSSPQFVDHKSAVGIPLNSSHIPLASTHLSLLVPLALAESSQGRGPANLHAVLQGSELGLKGSAGNESLNLTLLFYSQPELIHNGLSGETGSTFTCLRVTAPAYILPQTPHPPACPVSDDQDSPLNAITSAWNQNPQSTLECYCLKFTPNPSLTVILSQEERDLAGHHLIMVSACLLSVCGVLCFLGSLPCSKSQRYQDNGLDLKEPLIDS
ncbi:transmembrane protein 248 isoform X2 [Anguilla rostrata]|uniref:transmembrane protein 248 isoform X2 n=1 Tax=Anguilla rostrata TaxID=7938 RepID=UPI0030CF2A05